MTAKAFYNSFAQYANGASRFKIFPIVSLAVAYLESNRPGAGVSVLASKYNNFHGIQVYPKWKGKTVKLLDNQAGNHRTFCVYPSVQAGFNGFAEFLSVNPRYAKAGVFNAQTPQQQINRIGEAGYSEVSTWKNAVNMLTNIGKTVKEMKTDSQGGLIIAGVILFYLFSKTAIFARRD
jgi:flagellum-specific peptidoglycan hydrolase FlgJ